MLVVILILLVGWYFICAFICSIVAEITHRKLRFIFVWYDLWIGVYIDTKKSRFYVFPIPMFGIKVE